MPSQFVRVLLEVYEAFFTYHGFFFKIKTATEVCWTFLEICKWLKAKYKLFFNYESLMKFPIFQTYWFNQSLYTTKTHHTHLMVIASVYCCIADKGYECTWMQQSKKRKYCIYFLNIQIFHKNWGKVGNDMAAGNIKCVRTEEVERGGHSGLWLFNS